MKFKWLALAAAAAVHSAPAASQMVTAQDPQSIAAALQKAGYPAQVGTDKVGDPLVTSSRSGTTFQIYFYNCTANANCATVTFHSGYDLKTNIGLEKINEWNRTKRFGRAYLDKENDPILEMDVDLDDGGVSTALFHDNVEFWASVLGEFEKHIGFRK